MINFLYIVLAALGLGFLIFIHELAHYWMALRVGMRVEVFSIGLGKAIYSWKVKGVTWQIGWLPFGGFVKIAGMTHEKNIDIYSVPGGYFTKKPWDRIKVAAIAPIVNIAFAFFLFTLIWAFGGRDKPFGEFTNKLGWVDPKSELYASGIRAGDSVLSYNGKSVHSFKDLFQGVILSGNLIDLQGYQINYLKQTKQPYNLTVSTYPLPGAMDETLVTCGALAPASYLIYDKYGADVDNPLSKGSPMLHSGIEYGDRLMWVDGELVFSILQLNSIINSNQVLLTIERDGKTYLARLPRVKTSELRLSAFQRDELADWQHEANLKTPFSELYVIPYFISTKTTVETPMRFVDSTTDPFLNPSPRASDVVRSLLPGDTIIAVDGTPIHSTAELLTALQDRQVNIIVERGSSFNKQVAILRADEEFSNGVNWRDLAAIANSIGTKNTIASSGKYRLLNPIQPKTLNHIYASADTLQSYTTSTQEQLKAIDNITDPEKKQRALDYFTQSQERLYLGIGLQDRKVTYNPPPYAMFGKVVGDIWSTLGALVKGNLHPKWLSGPVGIVHIMQHGWSLGIKEALYWLGLISLNLGILNLLPIPVLDGGHICFALWEIVTKKRLQIKTMEKFILPFIVLLIGFFIFVTYHDLSRLFRGM